METNVSTHQAVYLRFVYFTLCIVCFSFIFLKLFVCLSQRGLNRSREVYFSAYKRSQVLFIQRANQTGRDSAAAGIEKGRALCLNPNPQPCGHPCPVTATPSLDLSGLAALAEPGQGVCLSAQPHPEAPGTVYAVGTR